MPISSGFRVRCNKCATPQSREQDTPGLALTHAVNDDGFVVGKNDHQLMYCPIHAQLLPKEERR